MSDFRWESNIARVKAQILAAASEGMEDAGEVVSDVAAEHTPVLTGHLRESRYVEVDGLTVRVGYRDEISVIVHEDTHARHDDGGPKFLERAMNESRGPALAALAARLRPLFE